jgi:hypothetical protein
MYKKYNFKPESLSPQSSKQKLDVSVLAERLVPFLIIATSFVWLWR